MPEFTIGPLGNWEGTAKVIIKTGNIAEEKVDAICISVGSTLEHSSSTWKAITKICGTKVYKDAYEKARKAQTTWLNRGEILVVDTRDTKLDAKYVFLVVLPDIYHLETAYTNIFREAIAHRCTSVAIPGLGCEANVKGMCSGDESDQPGGSFEAVAKTPATVSCDVL
ncbi:unnamed protein product [Strongylus vulgaris]|uniref:Macro domain-containing protein n=1 Tax=Strongylus vulgaris TaxID=40348 RepID=A0A3P7LF19_STRVU|nr:unnamed protein product [Strongylus vulgaris]